MSSLRAASSISVLTLVSRILGFVRDMIMLRALGSSWAMGTFILAWMFPNMLRRLVGEGALSASFIPSFAATLDRDGKPAARSLLGSVTGALLLALSVLTGVVLVLCAVLPPAALGHDTESGVGSAETGALLLQLTAILFPYVILICLVAVYNGALNSLHVFAWPAALPAILNVFWIAGLVIGMHLFDGDGEALTTIMAAFLLFAGFVQLAVPLVLLRRLRCLPMPRLPRRGDPAHAVFANMAPIVLGMSMLQINALVDQGFAYYLIEPGANTHVYLANRLVAFPHALTAVALATAVFPRFAVLASREQLGSLREKAGDALQTSLFVSVPACVGLILIAPDFIELFFGSDEFGAEDVRWSTLTTCCLVAGLPFMGVAQLYTRALYALGDNKTPAKIACALVPLNLGLNLVFLYVLGLGVAGLTLATTLCAVLDAALLRQRFRSHCDGTPPILGPAIRVVAATAVMAGAVLLAASVFDANTSLEVATFRLALPITFGVVAYCAVQWLTGNTELRRLWARLRE